MSTVLATGILRRISKKYNIFIDIPNKNRKFHSRPTPVIGGIGILSGFLIGILTFLLVGNFVFVKNEASFVSVSSLELLTDYKIDKFDISLKIDNEAGDTFVHEINDEGDKKSSLKLTRLENGKFIASINDKDGLEFTVEGNKVENSETGEIFIFSKELTSSLLRLDKFTVGLLIASIVIILISIIDDYLTKGLNPFVRLSLQAIISMILILYSDIKLNNLGFNILGNSIELGLYSIPFTIFAVIGITNAFNMSDGLNGLCASLCISCIILLIVVTWASPINYILIILVSCLLGFLMYNLGLFGRKRRVFLGDNGSTFLGFLVAWFCIYFSEYSTGFIKPVTALWFVAIPLIDCISLIWFRISIGNKPFEPDRNHIHHMLFEKLSFIRDKQIREFSTLLILLVASILLGVTGLIQENYNVNPNLSLLSIVSIGFLYHFQMRIFRQKKN